jgi:hypothetical protein
MEMYSWATILLLLSEVYSKIVTVVMTLRFAAICNDIGSSHYKEVRE